MAGAQKCTTCAVGFFAASAASPFCARCRSSCSSSYNAASPSCYLASVLNGAGKFSPSVSVMWGGADWPTKKTDGWAQYAPAFANRLPFVLPAACMGIGAVRVSAASTVPAAASFVFAIPSAGSCSVSAVLSASGVANPSGLSSFSSSIVTALSVTFAGGTATSWQVYGAFKGTITQLSGLTLSNAYPVVTVVGSTATFGYAGTTSALGFPSGTAATISDDTTASNAAFAITPQSQNFAGQSGFSPAAITKPLTTWMRTLMGSATLMVSSPSASVYYPLTANSANPSIVGTVSGDINFNGFAYTAQVYTGWAPAVNADGNVLPVSAPFVFIQLTSPVFKSWEQLAAILPIPKIAGVSVPSVVDAMFGWLPMPTAQLQILGVTTSVDFTMVPAAYVPAVTSSTAGLYAVLTIGFPTGPCGTGGKGMYYVGNAVCNFIITHPKVFQPTASLQLSISVNPVASDPATSILTVQASLNEIRLSKKVTFTTCAIYATIDMSGNTAFGLAVTFSVNAGSSAPLVLSGSIDFVPAQLGPPPSPDTMVLTASFQGYISRAFGTPFITLANVQVGPMTVIPEEPYIITLELQGTIVVYSKLATGNPAYLPASSPLVDLCTPGGASGDADSQNCLTATAAFGYELDPPSFWFYLSTSAVPVTPRSLVCIVGKYCASPDSPLGILLGEAVVNGFSVSMSEYTRSLLSGVIVPAGYNLFFNATVFGTLSAMANVTAQCSGMYCYYVTINMYAGPVLLSTQDTTSFEVAAYASITDPTNAYFFISLTIGSNTTDLGLPDILCKFGKFCGLDSVMKKIASVPAKTMVNASFSLSARDVTLINGMTVRLPRGFRAAWITTICGYTASLAVTVDATGMSSSDPRIVAGLDGYFGAYKSGPFKLCVSANNCTQGPYIHASFSLSTKGVNFNVSFSGYIQIYGATASVYGEFSPSNSLLRFSMQLWGSFSFSSVFRQNFVYVPSPVGDLLVTTGASLYLEMSADHLLHLVSLILDSLQASFSNANAAVQKDTDAAKAKLSTEYNACLAKASADAAKAARACDDCSNCACLVFRPFRWFASVSLSPPNSRTHPPPPPHIQRATTQARGRVACVARATSVDGTT